MKGLCITVPPYLHPCCTWASKQEVHPCVVNTYSILQCHFTVHIVLHCSFLLVTTVLAVDVTVLLSTCSCCQPVPVVILPPLSISLAILCIPPAALLDDFSIFSCLGSFTLAHGCFGLRAGGWHSPLYISDPDPSFLV